MHGNLWEIVNDRYSEFTGASAVDPTGPATNSGDIVIRGGGAEAWINRSASRVSSSPNDLAQNDEVGFRVAATNLDGLTFQINPGLNDAWYNRATDGQGILISVFPEIKQMFIAWFTFDTERPSGDVTAILGDPGHRWLTAQGPYEGDTATLTIFVTSGGVFDAADPPASTDPEGDGTMTIQFASCTEGLVSYEISSLDLSDDIPIERIAPDNVPLCETLASP